MTEIMNIIREMFLQYVGDGCYFLLFLLSFVFLLVAVRKQFQIRFLLYYIVGAALVFICPVTAHIIMEYGIGDNVYWRMMWLFPLTLVMATAGVFLLIKIKRRSLQMVVLAGMTAVLVFGGSYMYQWNDFTENINAYKLPEETFVVCDTLLHVADDEEEIVAVFPDELVCYVRQYTGKIVMPYGRWAVYIHHGFKTREAKRLYKAMNSPDKIADRFTQKAWQAGCNYIVLRKDDNVNNTMAETDYLAVADTENYVIYQKQ